MKRFLSFLAVLAFLVVPLSAHAQNTTPKEWVWEGVTMRNTGPSGTVADPSNWIAAGGKFYQAFLDSSVFRVGTWAASVADTTEAFDMKEFPFPPTYAMRTALDGANYLRIKKDADPSQHGPAGTDSLVTFLPDTLDNTRWIAVRMKQDTTSLSFSGSTSFDSVLVAAQWSEDGVSWQNVGGTPTRAFISASFAINPTDGGTPVGLTNVEQTPGADVAEVSMECQPTLYTDNVSLIINRTMCMARRFLRFIVSAPGGTGQFALEIGHWK